MKEKNLKVSIVDRFTLKLEESGEAGDIIDLSKLEKLDTTYLEKIIADAKNDANQKLISDGIENGVKSKENELKLEYQQKLEEIKNYSAKLEERVNNIEKETEARIKLENKDHIHKLTTEKNNLINDLEKEKSETELKIKISRQELEKDLNEKHSKELQEKDKELREVKSELSDLKRERSSLGSSNIGKDLEMWCDNKFKEAHLEERNNIVWERYSDSGDRADYVYKVYATDDKKENELLVSAALEMKSEDPTSQNKQNMDSFYKKLDKDRTKKNLEYAIIVSELKQTANEMQVIQRVMGYEKMYIVRPEYFLLLLDIITAFGYKYKEIVVESEKEKLEFEETEKIMKYFDDMKNEILDNSVKHINTNAEEILKQAKSIEEATKKATEKICKCANHIKDKYLNTIKNKIKDFKINKIIKDINALN